MKKRYRVTEYNQLVITTRVKEGVSEELRPAGRFTLDKKNKLSYIISEPKHWRVKYSLPRKITFVGTWSLDKDHRLVCTLHRTKEQVRGERVQLRIDIKNATSDALIFAVKTRKTSGIHQARLFELRGRWQADKNNRLCFLAQGAQSQYDTLTLQGTWEVKNNVLLYRYRRTRLTTKVKKENALTFKGHWSIRERDKLAYVLSMKDDSFFSFKAHFDRCVAQKNRSTLKYRIGVAGEKPRVVTLYGVWKLGSRARLSFEIDYGKGRARQSRFGANISITDKRKITFQLKNIDGQELGMSVAFTRTFLRSSGRLFLRIEKMSKNPRIEGGVSIPW